MHELSVIYRKIVQAVVLLVLVLVDVQEFRIVRDGVVLQDQPMHEELLVSTALIKRDVQISTWRLGWLHSPF